MNEVKPRQWFQAGCGGLSWRRDEGWSTAVSRILCKHFRLVDVSNRLYWSHPSGG